MISTGTFSSVAELFIAMRAFVDSNSTPVPGAGGSTVNRFTWTETPVPRPPPPPPAPAPTAVEGPVEKAVFLKMHSEQEGGDVSSICMHVLDYADAPVPGNDEPNRVMPFDTSGAGEVRLVQEFGDHRFSFEIHQGVKMYRVTCDIKRKDVSVFRQDRNLPSPALVPVEMSFIKCGE